ncbi:hypothetical protein [Microbacterium sp.]|uniref:hypothetical protein n=1 Tax=Microbacterium sp. TaxID=51671 RepID=UPI0037C7C6AC
MQDTEFGRGVVVAATLLLRDRNGDDPFSEWVGFLLIVDLGKRALVAGVGPLKVGPAVNR